MVSKSRCAVGPSLLLTLAVGAQAIRQHRAEEEGRPSQLPEALFQEGVVARVELNETFGELGEGTYDLKNTLQCLANMGHRMVEAYKRAPAAQKEKALQIAEMGVLTFGYAHHRGASLMTAARAGVKSAAKGSVSKYGGLIGLTAMALLKPAQAMEDFAFGRGHEAISGMAGTIVGAHVGLLLQMPIFQRTLMRACPSPVLRTLAVGAVAYAAVICGTNSFVKMIDKASVAQVMAGHPPSQIHSKLPDMVDAEKVKLDAQLEPIKRWIERPENEKAIEDFLTRLTAHLSPANEDPVCSELTAPGECSLAARALPAAPARDV